MTVLPAEVPLTTTGLDEMVAALVFVLLQVPPAVASLMAMVAPTQTVVAGA